MNVVPVMGTVAFKVSRISLGLHGLRIRKVDIREIENRFKVRVLCIRGDVVVQTTSKGIAHNVFKSIEKVVQQPKIGNAISYQQQTRKRRSKLRNKVLQRLTASRKRAKSPVKHK